MAGCPGPAVLDVFIDPDELPSMPHIAFEQVWKVRYRARARGAGRGLT